MTVYQDSDIIFLDQYEYTGSKDNIYLKVKHYSWMMSTIGGFYKVLLNRNDRSLIYIGNEYYAAKYQAIEPSLVGDVLILGMGLAILDSYLVTGTNWVWVEKSDWLYNNITPANGTKAFGDAEDIDFLATLGTFDTILIDHTRTKRMNFASIMNVGANIIEMTI